MLPPFAVDGLSGAGPVVPLSVLGELSSQGFCIAVARPDIAVSSIATATMWRVRIDAQPRRRPVGGALSVDSGFRSPPLGHWCQAAPDVSA